MLRIANNMLKNAVVVAAGSARRLHAEMTSEPELAPPGSVISLPAAELRQ